MKEKYIIGGAMEFGWYEWLKQFIWAKRTWCSPKPSANVSFHAIWGVFCVKFPGQPGI